MTENNHSCDVLVIGGGLAGLCAAISASDCGASVILVNKGITGEAGSSPKSAGILAASFGHGDLSDRPWPDSAAAHAADTIAVGHDLSDPELVRHICEQATGGVKWLETMGVAFSLAADAGYVQLNAPGNSCPRACSAIGGGGAIITQLITQIESRDITILNQVSAVRLIQKGERVTGCNLHGEAAGPFTITCGAVVLAAGGATGLFPTVSGDPANMGAGLMLGIGAGAKAGNLEFIEFTLIYRVKGELLRIAGLAPFMARGGRLTNDQGDDLLTRHFPDQPTQQISRAALLRMVQTEITSGRGPVYLDCRHFTTAIWEEFTASQGPGILEKIASAGCDCRRELLEVVPAAHSVLAGLVIDQAGQTTISGLFAAGENATGIHGAGRLSGNGLTSCVVMGRSAGQSAADFAARHPAPSGPAAPADLTTSAGLSADRADKLTELVSQLRELAGNSLGIVRNDLELASAYDRLATLQGAIAGLGTDNQLVHEACQMARLAMMMVEASRRRTESRGVQFRSDHQRLDQRWTRAQILSRAPAEEDDRLSLPQPLPGSPQPHN